MDLRRELVPSPGSGPVYLHCPNHHDTGRPNLAVYADHTYCFRCGFHESASQFLFRIRRHPEQAQVPQVSRYRGYHAPARNWAALVPLWHQSLMNGSRKERLAYLVEERCLSHQTLIQQRLGHDGSRFVIPYWSGTQLLGVKLRNDPAFPRDGSKYWNSPGLSGLYRPNPSGRPVVVTEGEFDALVLAQYGADAVTAHNGNQGMIKVVLNAGLPWYGVLVATDWDEPGEESAQLLIQSRPGWVRLDKPWDGPGTDITNWAQSLAPIQRGMEIRRQLQRTWHAHRSRPNHPSSRRQSFLARR